MSSTKFKTGRLARDFAYKLVFEYMFVKEEDLINPITKETVLQAPELTSEDITYINEVYNGVKENYDDLIDLISRNLTRFSLNRVFKTDLAALLIACYELKFLSDSIPASVVISEAMELAELYSTEKSKKFVNGVLSGVLKELKGC